MTTSSAEITLFGATGITGRLIAAALDKEGLSYRLVGRSPEKLARLSAMLPRRPGWLVADAAQAATLPALFQNTRLVINCAGPFTDLGERVVALAALSGVHYLDTSNELGYVFRARGYNELARRNGAAIVPACAFEIALADCAGHLAGEALASGHQGNSLDAVDVVYWLSGGSSQGTRRSAVRSLATSWIAYRDGDWTGQIPGRRVRRFDLPGGPRYALTFPSCESITLPAHLPLKRVDTWFCIPTWTRFIAPLLVPLLARLSRSILRPLILNLAARGGAAASDAAPGAGLKTDSSFVIAARAARGTAVRTVFLQGSGAYDITAKIITYAAQQMTQPGYSRRGFLAPAEALDHQALLCYAQENWGISLQIKDGD